MMVRMPAFTDPVVPAGRLRAMTQPDIVVDELTLRPWRASDAPAIVAAYRDPAIQQWHVQSMTDEEATTWATSWARRWTTETGAGWAIETGGQVVGRMGLNRVNLFEGTAAAAYWVMREGRGRNVAPRALQAVTEWAFTEIGLHRIELQHSTRNEASCRVAVKAHYIAEGTKRSSGLHADGWHDMHLHARVND